jgi:hypothetical protein
MNVEFDGENNTVTLSRDGIFHLLPEKLFFEDNSLKKEGKRYFDFTDEYEELKKKKKEILSFFQPFDNTFFKLSLQLEKKLNYFAETGNNIYEKFFLNEAKPETNRYTAKIKQLLPFASQLRGNIPLLKDMLKIIINVDIIEIKEIEPLKKRFIIHKEGLTKEEYITMHNELTHFFVFLQHWFLPVEMKYDFRIKDNKQPFILGESLILDYNMNL